MRRLGSRCYFKHEAAERPRSLSGILLRSRFCVSISCASEELYAIQPTVQR